MRDLQASDAARGKAIPHSISTRFFDTLQQRVDALTAEGRAGKPFEIVMPDHQSRAFGRGEPASRVHLVTRKGVDALISLDELAICEAYMDGDINITGDLYDLIGYRSLLSDNRPLQYLWATYARTVLLGQVRADKKGIGSHYDIAPEFFQIWLDKSVRGYSHAFFNSDDEPLEPAMERKFQYGIDACGIKPGDRVLDIGGGWGSFVQYAGRKGIRVTSVTISQESEKFLKEPIQREGLPCTAIREHLLEFRPQEPFDAICNFGVTEHLPDYRGTIAQYQRLPKPGRNIYLDCYSGDRHRMSSFVTKWVFEGNTSPLALDRYFAELARTDFEVLLLQDDRHNYYLTCKKWAENLEQVQHQVTTRWGQHLYRRFRLYLWSSARAFADRTLGAHRMVLRHSKGLHARRKLFGQ